MAGTARDEAERLVAAVLAMAGSAGPDSGSDSGSASAGERVAAGMGTLSDAVSGFLGRLSSPPAGDAAEDRPADADSDSGRPKGESPGSGHVGSGHAGSGHAGSGHAGSGHAGSGHAGSGHAGSGHAGSGLGDTITDFVGSLSGGSGGGRQHRGGAWATGSAECCVCPVCRVISTMRDPSPETAVKLAIGAGELATGVASVMRAFSSMVGERTTTPPPARPRPENRDENWSTATRTTNRPDDARSTATDPALVDPAATNPAATNPAATNPVPAESPSATTTAAVPSAAGEAALTGPGPALTNAAVAPVGETAPQGVSGSAAARGNAGGDAWSAATTTSAAEVAAEHAAEVAERAARRAAEQAAQREAARAASQRAKEAAARVAEAVRLADAARDQRNADAVRDPESAEGHSQTAAKAGTGADAGGARPRTPRKRDVWAAATADAGVAAVGGGETLDHDDPGTEAGDGARGDGSA
jgi:hypothetical protein